MRWFHWLALGLGCFGLLVIGVAVYLHSQQGVLPASIRRQLSFSPFVVTDSTKEKVRAGSYKYDSQNQLFSFVVNGGVASDSFTVSEQQTPPNFAEIPDLYSKLIDGLNGYGTLETSNGTVDLTRPKNGKQTAVMNTRGVLLFAQSDSGDVSNDSWKRLIESLDIYKISN